MFVRIDGRKSGQVNVDQMKKFFIVTDTEATSLWSEMLDVFDLKDNQSPISFAVSIVLIGLL